MSVYGWLSWTRSAASRRVAGRACGRCHGTLVRRLLVTLLSFAQRKSARREDRRAAWPLLDSLTTWFSLLATWLAARAQARKLALLDRHRRSAGVPLLRARPAMPGAAQLCCSSASRPAASSPGAGACQRAGGARMIAGDAVAARAGLRRRRTRRIRRSSSAAARSIAVSWCARAAAASSCASTKTRRGSGPRSRPRARAAHRGGQRRHRAASGLRGARPLLPDHRLPRRPAVDAALLHAHARPAFARASACARCRRCAPPPVARFDPIAAARRYADLIVAQRPGRRRAHPVLVSQRRRSAGARRLDASARRPSCTATCITATCSPRTACTSSTGNTRRSAIRCSISPAS